jgi:hypothetical protein
VVGGVQVPDFRPGAVQGGTDVALTLAKSPVERISEAISDIRPVVTVEESVNDWVLDSDEPPRRQKVLRSTKAVRYF